jgi:hypothetical protein
MKELTPNGGCFPSDAFCKYTHIPGTPNDGDPEHYEGVPETEGLIWIPQP